MVMQEMLRRAARVGNRLATSATTMRERHDGTSVRIACV